MISDKTQNKINAHKDGIYLLSHRPKNELLEIIEELIEDIPNGRAVKKLALNKRLKDRKVDNAKQG